VRIVTGGGVNVKPVEIYFFLSHNVQAGYYPAASNKIRKFLGTSG
jgi:hypothetical protein